MIKRILCFSILLLSFILNATSQDSILIFGRVMDSFTHKFIEKVKIKVLSEEGKLIKTYSTIEKPGMYGWTYTNVFQLNVPKAPFVILSCSKEGYLEQTVRIPLKKGARERGILFEDILLKKEPMLQEVVVKATRVKMVLKGDTIEYNASAFQLSEGSMLDALIRQLPGVDLDENGRITVNGRFVSSLLVNGEDFFKGDPSIALENLPAYMVNKVKVYEKEAPDAYLKGRKEKDKNPLVMDVNLKKQYSIGWIANAEGGYGTNDYYLAKFFGLRFTNQSRLALFGNINNVNDTREPGNSGSWNSVYNASGQTTLKNSGVDFLVKDKYGKWKLQGNLKARHEDIFQQTETSSVRFFQNGDVFKRERNYGKTRRSSVSTDSKIEFPLENIFFSVSPSAEYKHYNNTGIYQSAEFSEDPIDRYLGATLDSIFYHAGSGGFEKYLTNRLETKSIGSGYRWRGDLKFDATIKIPHTPDVLLLYAKGSAQKANDKQYQLYDLRYPKTMADNEFRNTYDLRPETYYNLDFATDYLMRLESSNFIPSYSFNGSYTSGGRSLYRLDKYADYGNPDKSQLGVLPSTTDSLQQVIDMQNSYHSTLRSFTHKMKLDFNLFLRNRKDNLTFVPVFRYKSDHLKYQRNTIDADKKRNGFFFEPTIYYKFLNKFEVAYDFSLSQPYFADMLDIIDDANPLYIWQGNPNLKNTHNHHAKFEASWRNAKRGSTTDAGLHYNLWLRSIGNFVVYNRETGVTKASPRNINGNWRMSLYVNHNAPLDKKKLLTFSTNSRVSFRNSVDFASVDGETSTSSRNSVRWFNFDETIKANYKIGKNFIAAKINIDWSYARSPRTDFSTINCVDMSYGLNGKMALPWQIELTSDLTLYSRRGYDDASMNTDDFVWNASLSKGFLKGNLFLIIDGFDILGQLSNIRYTLNAQGRTETRYNTVPRYVMVRAIYRLNINPKKK